MKARRLPQDGIVLEVVENLQEIIWDKIGSAVKRLIKSLVENLLEDELTELLGAERYERSSKRKGYRNGHYERNHLTVMPEIPQACLWDEWHPFKAGVFRGRPVP